jgi:hypothetical protein
MDLLLHHPNNRRELDELIGFRSHQRILFEERNDPVRQIAKCPNVITKQVLAMIVMTSIDEDVTASEVLLQYMQDSHAPLSLDHCKGWLNLPTEPVRMVPEDRKTEAAFTVDEADDPLLDSWPFLLIARTGWIFTGHAPTIPGGSDMAGTTGYSGVPAYSQLHITPSPVRGAARGGVPLDLP